MKTKHTPGPWLNWDCGNGIVICPAAVTKALIPNAAAFQCEITRVMPPQTWTDAGWEEQKANARLIAAAPELLECLKALAKENAPISIRDEHNRALEIIAKAEGRKNG